jgi:CRP-like cAMP-binding protein
MSGGALHAGIAWDVVFILINGYQIWRLVIDRRSLASLAEVQLLRQGAFADFASVELASVLRTGAWRDFAPGTRLTEEGKPVPHLVLICDGQASVESGGEEIANLHGGTFVGEMAFLSGNPASATVTVARPTRAFVFDMAKLEALARENDSVAGDLYRAIGRDLARKLSRKT